jgi:hypothetical protein
VDLRFDTNPIDLIVMSARGLPPSGLEFLAIQNPRPAQLVLSSLQSKHGARWPWDELSDKDWADEMRFNSGSFIAVLLRHQTALGNPDFVQLFESFDRSYRAVLKRRIWALPVIGFRTKPERLVKRVIAGTRESLAELEQAFAAWATANRQLVRDVVSEILAAGQDSPWASGNAMTDLDRVAPAWRTT